MDTTTYHQKLRAYLDANKLELHDLDLFSSPTFLLKGDISGIQEYIFTTKSKGASKTLKAKSLFVQALAEMCVCYIKHQFGEQNVALLYNGGGNFYLFVPKDEEKLKTIQQTIAQSLLQDEIYVALSWTEHLSDFEATKEKLNEIATRNKYKKFEGVGEAFDTFPVTYEQKEARQQAWRAFARNLVGKTGFSVFENKSAGEDGLSADGFVKFDMEYKLENNGKFDGSVLNVLPTWNEQNLAKYNADLEPQTDDEGHFKPLDEGDIIEFSHLADIAKARTDTDKLGVLKMDVDNLGSLFQAQTTIKETQDLSLSLKWFFELNMRTLLQEKFEYVEDIGETTEIDAEGKEIKTKTARKAQETYQDNIYVVFSGGDDCFMLGAFDAVMEFALLIQKEFQEFQRALQKILPTIEKEITLSASLILVNGGFPVTRFAELAEDALKDAKRKDADKNRISVFGKVLKWSEFRESQKIAEKLQELVTIGGTPRGILERVRNSAIGYEKLQIKAQQGKISMPKVWRLKYYLRNVKNKDNFKLLDELFDKYIEAILLTLAGKLTISPETFRVAARWAEFLTRKDFSKPKNNEDYEQHG